MQDFVPTLKAHLLPWVREILRQEADSSEADPHSIPGVVDALQDDIENGEVFIKNDRMYRHNLVRFNFTTYDVRRDQDVVNPNTPHCNIILLANRDESITETSHPFLYARVLGIYHVNVIYTSSHRRDYSPRRIDFLWVRWFRHTEDKSLAQTWRDCRLDMVHFPPVGDVDVFGFVDPRDVLRGCHIVPAFARGMVHTDGWGISSCAADVKDFRRYYVIRYDTHVLPTPDLPTPRLKYQFPRFVDRDMLMRYHWR